VAAPTRLEAVNSRPTMGLGRPSRNVAVKPKTNKKKWSEGYGTREI
jgi:hypothetical protein